MDTIEWNLLLQIPLAAVVVMVVMVFLRHLKEVTTEFTATVKELNISFASTITKQQETFMLAIKEQREQNIASLNIINSNIQELDKAISDRLEEMAVAKARVRKP